MSRREQAVELKHRGANCCQAVLLAFQDVTGMDEATLRALGAGFGIGMGRMEGTCGALVAAEMLLGLVRYQGKPIIRDAGALHEQFRERAGATLCHELKGRDSHVIVCDCDDCVRHAVDLVEETCGA